MTHIAPPRSARPSRIERTRAYLAAYAARDLPALGALLADAVVLRDWKLRVAGKPAALDETRKNFSAVRQLGIEILGLYERPEGVAAELRIDIENLDGSLAVIFVVDAFDFDADDRITAIRAFIGRGDDEPA